MRIQSMVKEMLEAVLPEPAMVEVRKLHYLRKLKGARPTDEPDLAISLELLGNGDQAVDCGANYGLYTRFFAEKVGPTGRVYSVEPVPSTFAVLSANVRRLNLANATVVNKAVSDEPGQVTMTVPVGGGGKNFYQAHIMKSGEAPAAVRSFTVEASPIDRIVPDGAAIRLMKVDVEGHELPAMKGALGLLRRDEPALLIEVSGSPDVPGSAADLFRLLTGLGYRVYASAGLSLHPYAPGMRSVNYFFLRDAHLSRLRASGVRLHG